MNNLRKLVKQTLVEKYYTTWKSIHELDELGPLQYGEGVEELHSIQNDIVQKLSKHFNIKKIHPLGSGTQGYAYYIPNNKVLKITTDKSEAADSNKIKGKKLKHLANIYGVYSLKGKYDGFYVTISELLNQSHIIDEADQSLSDFLRNEFRYDISLFFEDYSNGSMSKDEVKDYIKQIKEYFKEDQKEAEQTIWFMTEKFALIDEVRANKIASQDWGLTNIGLKRDGHLAMYDLGYGNLDAPDNLNNIELNEFISADEYPDFFDGQFNPSMHAYPPVQNMNNQPLAETEISSEEINKKDLPYKFSHLFDDFVTEKTEAEVREIAPTIDLNQKPVLLMMSLEVNYPSLFDTFADWLFEKEKSKTTVG